MDFYIPIASHSHAVNSHSFPFPSISIIPISTGFPLGYFRPIPIGAQQNNEV